MSWRVAVAALALQIRAAPVSYGLLVATSVAGGLGQPIAAELLRRLLDTVAPARSGHAMSVLRLALLLIAVAAVLVALQYVGSYCAMPPGDGQRPSARRSCSGRLAKPQACAKWKTRLT